MGESSIRVEHVDLVDEEHAGRELNDALLDVARDHLVDLAPQLVSDLRLLRLHLLPDHRHHVLPVYTQRRSIVHKYICTCTVKRHPILALLITRDGGKWWSKDHHLVVVKILKNVDFL